MNDKLCLPILVVLPLIFIPAVQAQNLIANPSFEEPAGNYRLVPGGSSEITGWTTSLNGVEVITSTDLGLGVPFASTIAHGRQAVDVTPFTFQGGGLSQTFGTQAGALYRLTFSAGTASNFGRSGGTLNVEVPGLFRQFDLANPLPDIAWQEYSLTFAAQLPQSTLTFSSLDNALTHFVMVDNVSVVLVPEPSTLLLAFAGAGWLLIRRKRVA